MYSPCSLKSGCISLTQTSEHSAAFVVEFVGVPGVGKSTISRRVASRLGETYCVDQPTYDINEGLGPRLRPIAKFPYALEGLFRTKFADVLGLSAGNVRPSIMFNWVFVVGIVSRRIRPDRVVLLDQGLIQALWSFVFGGTGEVTEGQRRALSNVFPETRAIVVLVEASPETVGERLESRPTNPSRVGPDSTTPFSLADAFEAYDEVADTVNLLVGSWPNASLIRISNEDRDDLEDASEAIADEIHARLSS